MRADTRAWRLSGFPVELPIGQLEVAVEAPDQLAVDEHAHDIDGVERHAPGAVEDVAEDRLGQARRQPGEQLRHGRFRQPLEMDGREAAMVRTPAGAAVEELGASQCQDHDRVVTRPGHEMVDEVEQA